MATLTCWIRNNETGEITEHKFVNQLPFLIGKQEFVKEADYLAYHELIAKLSAVLRVGKRKFTRTSRK
jgi:hypothetical protein